LQSCWLPFPPFQLINLISVFCPRNLTDGNLEPGCKPGRCLLTHADASLSLISTSPETWQRCLRQVLVGWSRPCRRALIREVNNCMKAVARGTWGSPAARTRPTRAASTHSSASSPGTAGPTLLSDRPSTHFPTFVPCVTSCLPTGASQVRARAGKVTPEFTS
jgi:hypothetical protein